MSEKEVRAIPGFDGYFVTRDGEVYSSKRGGLRQRVLTMDSKGYLKLSHYRNGRHHKTFAHQLVLLAWFGPRPEGAVVNHINGVPTDNRVENLEWVSRLENERHARRALGKNFHGSRNSQSKLTEADIPEIRRLRSDGWTFQAIGDKFGVKFTAIAKICYGQSWKHV